MEKNKIDEILTELETGYDQIADKFSETRSHFWPDLAFISSYISDGDKILDFGCGNGRLLEILKDKKIEYEGADVSRKLIDIAKSKYPERNFIKLNGQGSLPENKAQIMIGNNINELPTMKEYPKTGLSQRFVAGKPFQDNYFNKIVSVAVFHHFPEEYAQKIAQELFRIIKPQGMIIVTVWNLAQERFKKFVKNGSRDLYIPFKDNEGKRFERYHRFYAKEDLERIFSAAGFKTQKIELVGGKNIVYIGGK